ncbi:MAG: NifB/NifX family molybdenum-iron cluster-binding protein [Kiritimatiellia bacterium]
MKIAITATDKNMASSVDLRFGRAKYFIVVDTDTNEWSAHDNTQNLNAAQGAGIQAAEKVAQIGVQVWSPAMLGPKTYRVVNVAGTKVYLCDQITVAEATTRLKAGELKQATGANVEGHWA